MNYLKQEFQNANSPMNITKALAQTLEPYLQLYSLLRINNLKDFVESFPVYKIFSVRGAEGSGKCSFKTLIKNMFLENISIFDFCCSEITELDDIFLKLYKFILKNPLKHDVLRAKKNSGKQQSIDEQILYYLKNNNGNIVLIFNNFDKLLDNNLSFKAQNVKSFFEFLSTLSNIKVVIFTSVSVSNAIEFPDNVHFATTLDALDENQVKDFLSIFKVETSNSLLSQIYDLTYGYIFSLKFFALATNILSLPASELIKECNLKKQPLNNYIARKLISKLSDDERKVLYYIVFFRHDISLNVLKSIDYFDDIAKSVNKLREYMFLYDIDNLEARTFIKKMLYDSLPAKEKMNFHEKIADFYGEQLPLNPDERVIEISRTSMYSEKFYHYNACSKLSKNIQMQSNKYEDEQVENDKLSSNEKFKYMASNRYFPDFDVKTNDEKFSSTDNSKSVNIDIDDDESSLSGEQKNLLKDISGNDYIAENKRYEINSKLKTSFVQKNNSANNSSELPHEEINDFDKAQKFIEKANEALLNDNFSDAITNFKNALLLLQDTDNQQYEKIKLALSKVLIDASKLDEAQKYLSELSDENNVSDLQSEVFLELGSIAEYKQNSNLALDYYSKALNCAEELNLYQIKTNVYFKMALLFDDSNEIDNALEYYILATEESTSHNIKSHILASAYSNIASIYEEKNEFQNALNNYKKSIKIDVADGNYEGLSKTYSSIGNLFLQKDDFNMASKFFLKETQYAKLTNDSYLKAAAYLELGDAFMSLHNYKNALKAYLLSKKNIDNTISTDSKNKIERRFDIIVNEIGEQAYRFLLRELRNNGK